MNTSETGVSLPKRPYGGIDAGEVAVPEVARPEVDQEMCCDPSGENTPRTPPLRVSSPFVAKSSRPSWDHGPSPN